MIINTKDIPESGMDVQFREPARFFPALKGLEGAGEYEFTESVQVRINAMKTSGMIQVVGKVETRVSLACGRCLKPCAYPVAKRLELTFARDLPEVYDSDTHELVEITTEEMGLIPVSGEEIDLTEAVQEQVVMALPMRI